MEDRRRGQRDVTLQSARVVYRGSAAISTPCHHVVTGIKPAVRALDVMLSALRHGAGEVQLVRVEIVFTSWLLLCFFTADILTCRSRKCFFLMTFRRLAVFSPSVPGSRSQTPVSS